MNITQTVALENITCFAFHGVFPEEQLLGNIFVCSVYVRFPIMHLENSDDLGTTIDYACLHSIVQQQMNRTQRLLETVAQNIVKETLLVSPKISSIKVEIRKKNPPFGTQVAHSLVSIEYER